MRFAIRLHRKITIRILYGYDVTIVRIRFAKRLRALDCAIGQVECRITEHTGPGRTAFCNIYKLC